MVLGVVSGASIDQPEIGLGSMEQEEAEALEDALAGLENEGGATVKQRLPENASALLREERRIEKPALNAADTATSR